MLKSNVEIIYLDKIGVLAGLDSLGVARTKEPVEQGVFTRNLHVATLGMPCVLVGVS